jgi:hypothetical protein
MTDAPTTDLHTVPQADTLAPSEFAALDREDSQAGRVIGWLLAFFFLYTIVVSILVAWWTWDALR